MPHPRISQEALRRHDTNEQEILELLDIIWPGDHWSNQRNRDLVRRRLTGNETYGQLAETYGITKERVSQIVLTAARLSWDAKRKRDLPEGVVGRQTPPFDMVGVRASNILKNEGINTLEELQAYVEKYGRAGLLRIPNCGAVSANEIMGLLGHPEPMTVREAAVAFVKADRAVDHHDLTDHPSSKVEWERLREARRSALLALYDAVGVN